MKILLVSSGSGSRGGGEIYLHHLAAGLARLGHRVHGLCSLDPVMDELARDLSRFAEVRREKLRNSYRRPTRSLGAALDFEQQRRLSQIFRELTPDIIHVNQQVSEDGLDLLLAARRSGIPFLSTIHISHSAEVLGARLGKLRDLIARSVLKGVNTAHIAVSDRGKRDLLARFGFLRDCQVPVVLSGVLFSKMGGTTIDGHRARWGVVPGQVILGSLGRLVAQKGPIFALEVVAALRKKGLSIQYIWIGDGIMRNAFEERARQLGIADVVRLDGWRDDTSSCLRSLDVLLMPSKFEGLPLALMEAMGAGLCCCVSDVDGMREAIEPGVNGYLCEPGNLQVWCEQLEALIKNPTLRAELGKRATETARRRFSLESMASATVKVYEDVIRLHDRSRQEYAA